MIFRLNPSSGVPLYLQLMEQVKHAVEMGALREGDQLPAIRKVAEDLVMNPNTVVRAYRELEHEGVLELKHGSGAFIRESAGERGRLVRKAQSVVQAAIERLRGMGLTDDELRRAFENELAQESGLHEAGGEKKMSDPIIETDQLCKSYKGVPALRGLDLSVPAGSIYGFLGRNGAGKTTTIKTLLGLLHADSGTARIFGLPVMDADKSVPIRRRIGFVAEDKELYPYMTVGQAIQFTRPFFPKWRSDLERRYLEMFELPLKKKIPDLSKGMRSKLMLLLAISRGAELLILDEPTDGLDPAAIEDVLKELVALTASSEITIFFSSHQLSEVERIADHIGVIDRGRLVVSGALDDMKASYQRLHITLADAAQALSSWGDGVVSARQEGRVVSILAARNADAIAERARAIPGAIVERFPVTLSDIFLEHVRSN